MFIEEETLDDVLMVLYEKILGDNREVSSSRGDNLECLGVLIKISNPRARLSRSETKGTIFSCFGEFLWYLSGRNDLDFIRYYIRGYEVNSDDGVSVYGGYGPRLINKEDKYNQIENVLSLLTTNKNTRKAVVQLFDSSDLLDKHADIPCTCSLQFFIRDEKLYMVSHMRSNDAYRGLPHDVFSFTMLQEYLAVRLGVGLGDYFHSVSSMHIYKDDIKMVTDFLEEGWHRKTSYMPAMPAENPVESMCLLLKAEESFRLGNINFNVDEGLDEYWMDIVNILKCFALSKNKDVKSMQELICDVSFEPYQLYVRTRIDKTIKKIHEESFEN